MAGHVALLVVGAALLVAAGVAGPIGLKRMGSTPSLAVAGAGLMCAIAGVILLASGSAAKGAVSATITHRLDPRLASDQVTVFLDGRSVGVMRVDTEAPTAKLKVTVSKAGRHEYRLDAIHRFKDGTTKKISHGDDLIIDGEHPLLIYLSTDKDITPALSQPLKY